MVHALKHTKYGSITRHNNGEQDLSVIVKPGALHSYWSPEFYNSFINQRNSKTAPLHVTVHLLRFEIWEITATAFKKTVYMNSDIL